MSAREFHPGMGQAVAERTILRKDKDGKFETWADVARRVALGNTLLCAEGEDREAEFEKMHGHLSKATLLMSGRHLQHGDETQPIRSQEVYTNCSTSATTFGLFLLLMSGSGVGRCYDNDVILVDWDYSPNLRCVLDESHPDYDYINHESLRDARHKYTSENTIWHDVEDSREGWAKAVEVYETLTYQRANADKVLVLNFTPVRCKNTPIGGMQGRPASGPAPLMKAFEKVASIKGAGMAPWKQAMFVDHYFAECVLVGGARRSARMSTKTWRDLNVIDFIQIKRPIEFLGKTGREIAEIKKRLSPGSFLWSSNNSVLVDSDFWKFLSDDRELEGEDRDLVLHARRVFLVLTEAAYFDGTGEPGIINQHKLLQNNEGLQEALFNGDYMGSEKYKVNPETSQFLRELALCILAKPLYMITNPCGEENLSLLNGFCTIADTVPFFADTLDEAESAFRTATKALIRVNTLDSIYSKEVRRTNRIGVGITGVHEFAWKFFRYGFRDLIDEKKSKDFWMTMSRFGRAVQEEAEEYSKIHGLPLPHSLRTQKPAGTTSKLFGLTEGSHLPSLGWYLRWVQFSNSDPLVETYARAGYPTRELKTYRNTTIVGFPTKLVICDLMPADKIVYAGEATPEEQYQWLKLLEKYWIECVDEDGNSLPPRGAQVSYCLAGDKNHLIATSSGLQHIESFSPAAVYDRNGNLQRVTDLYDNGVKPVKSVRLTNGIEIIGTVEHKILCVTDELNLDWKAIGDISEGDIIVRRVGDELWSQDNAQLPHMDARSGNVKNPAFPTHMNEDLAEFVGMLMSDGFMTVNGIGVVNIDAGVRERFANLVKSLFKLEGSEKTDPRSGVTTFSVNSRQLKAWLSKLGVARYHDGNSIPAYILMSRRECISKFIKGYTLDGYVMSGSGNIAVASTTSEKMAKDLISVLFNMGFDAYLGRKKGRPYWFSETNNGMGKDQFQVVIPSRQVRRFIDTIGFSEERKNNEAKNVKPRLVNNGKFNVLPARPWKEFYRANRTSFGKNDRLRSFAKSKSRLVTVNFLNTYFRGSPIGENLLGDHSLRFTCVKKVVDLGPMPTFDITVDVSHEYSANSVVVHNTLKYDPKKVTYEAFAKTIREQQSQVRCCSVMPQEDASAYEYQPEEPISKEAYEEIVDRIAMLKAQQQVLDLVEDIGKEHIDCAGGACPVDFKRDK